MALFWISVLIVGVVIDSLTSGFLFSIASLSSLLGIILNLFNLPRYLQFIICLIVSIILTLTLVPYVKKKMKNSKEEFLSSENRMLGRKVVLTEDLSNTCLINIDGVYWTLKTNGAPLHAGDTVQLVSIEGNKFIVEKI